MYIEAELPGARLNRKAPSWLVELIINFLNDTASQVHTHGFFSAVVYNHQGTPANCLPPGILFGDSHIKVVAGHHGWVV